MPVTIDEWVVETSAILRKAGFEGGRMEAQILAGHAAGQSRSWVLAHGNETLPPGVEPLLERRLNHEPLAYILGFREFYGRDYKVDRSVLVPRHETETVVETAMKTCKSFDGPVRVLDIGTGSGCIAVTLALELDNVEVTAVDISAEAIATAKENAKTLGAKVEFIESDLFHELPLEEKFDVIVSNPPYIATTDEIAQEIRDWEPDPALWGGSDGLQFYHRIAIAARHYLTPKGRLVFEIGDEMSGAVKWTCEEEGWVLEEVVDDLNGMPRAAVLKFVG